MEFTLLGGVFVAVLALYATLYWEARRGNAADCTHDLWEIAISAAVAGLIVGRLAAMIGAGVNPITNPADIIIVRGGVATGPAGVGAILTAAWLGRRDLWPVLDGLAAGALAGLGGWHLGCIVRDSCLGTPSDLPWAMTQPGSTVSRHPVEIYAALALFAGAIVLIQLRSRGRLRPAVASSAALAWAGLVRLATEPLRPTLSGGPILWYWGAIAVGVLILVLGIRAVPAVTAGGKR
ncbi:MAG: prolipoprotein diacylglyceryl transferase [Acidimicrobiia bacterium]|nr:prolipoprotein diacylglyceryl transferase [Acidimicrobiia bacterium]